MNQKVKGAIMTFAGGMCWGLSGSMGQYMFQHENMDSKWLVPIRLGLAGIILIIYSLIRYSPKIVIAPWKNRKESITLVVYGLLGVSLCQFFYFLTIQLSSAAMATILQDFAPIMILFTGCIMTRRKPRANEIIAVVLALVGVALISTHGDLSNLIIAAPALIAGIISAVCATIYNVAPGELMKKYPVPMLQGWAFIMGSLVFILIFRPWTYHYVPSLTGIAGIAFVVIVGNILAFPLYMIGVKYIGPEKGILYAFSEPVTAAIIGVLFLGNTFNLYDIAGFIIIFVMLMLISVFNRGKSDNKVSQKLNVQETKE